jgi:hypothetical protein
MRSPAPIRSRSALLAAALLAIAGAAVACGQGVVPGDSYDQPLFVVQGLVKPAGALASARNGSDPNAPARPLVSLLWTDPLQRVPDRPAPAGTLRSSAAPGSDAVTLEIFRLPPPELLVDVAAPSGDSARRR